MNRFFPLFALAVCVSQLSATITVQLAPSLSSPQLLGTTINMTASASDTNAGSFDYQFSVASGNGPYAIVQDYDVSNVFPYTGSSHEGKVNIQVIARNTTTQETSAPLSIPFLFNTRITSGQPVISTTSNPLVAFYSAPSCPTGSTIYVQYSVPGGGVKKTNSKGCATGVSSNFYVAGMLPSTTYNMNYVVVTGGSKVSGPVGQFTTAPIDPSINLPVPIRFPMPENAATCTAQSVLLLDPFNNPTIEYVPIAMNLKGAVIWYYAGLNSSDQYNAYFIRPLSSATMILYMNDPNSTLVKGQIFREIDFAGNVIRQTSATRVSQQLTALGRLGITGFNHDAIRLPNGHTIVKATQEEIFPAGTQGSTGPVDILGDAVIDLDTNLQVAWSWSAFDHIDINHASPLGEVCSSTKPDCPPFSLAATANDWTHGNSLNYIPASGDILFSMRNLDWVVKLDYNNGTGTGNVLWTMGLGGNFAINSTDPYPWFSHQHDVEYELNGTTVLSIFDNGNTRVSQFPGEHSRGYVLNVDEINMIVTPTLLADLGYYSPAVGSAQRLDNGDYHFELGWIPIGGGNFISEAVEVLPTGALNYVEQNAGNTYRGYRMDSLYVLDGPGN